MQDYSFEPYWNFKTTKILKKGALIKMRPFKQAGYTDREVLFKVLGFDGRYVKLVNLQDLGYMAGFGNVSSGRTPVYAVSAGSGYWTNKYTYAFGETEPYYSVDVDLSYIANDSLKQTLLSAMKDVSSRQYGYLMSNSSDYDYKVNSTAQSGYSYYKKLGQADSFSRKLVPFDMEEFISNFGSMTPIELHDWFCYDGYEGGSQTSTKTVQQPIAAIQFKDSFAVTGSLPSYAPFAVTLSSAGQMRFQSANFEAPASSACGYLWEVDLWTFKDWEFFEDWDN